MKRKKQKETNQEAIKDWRRVIKENKKKTKTQKHKKHRSILADMELNDE